MYPYIHIILPSYTVMAFLGGFFSLIFLYFRLEKYKIDFTYFLRLSIVAMVSCLIGSKILFIITKFPNLFSAFTVKNLILTILQSGFVFYGGLFGTIFGLYFYTRKDNTLRTQVFRFVVPAFPLFLAFGRIGCLLAGCCYGKEIEPHIIIGGVEFARIPVPIFESVFEFIMFIFLIIFTRKKPEKNILPLYLICYAVFRFFNEFLRGDEIRGFFVGLSTSQWISMVILIFYILKFSIAHFGKLTCENLSTSNTRSKI